MVFKKTSPCDGDVPIPPSPGRTRVDFRNRKILCFGFLYRDHDLFSFLSPSRFLTTWIMLQSNFRPQPSTIWRILFFCFLSLSFASSLSEEMQGMNMCVRPIFKNQVWHPTRIAYSQSLGVFRFFTSTWLLSEEGGWGNIPAFSLSTSVIR